MAGPIINPTTHSKNRLRNGLIRFCTFASFWSKVYLGLMNLSGIQKIVLGILFFLAMAVRCIHINSPPFEYHPVRQFYSALTARSLYQVETEEQTQKEKDIPRLVRNNLQPREPQILQTIVSWIYRLIGRESFLVPRLISMSIWMVGGLFLLGLTRELFGPKGALSATAAYLFFPFGIHTSRAFMPESLMNALFILALWMIFRYHKKPTVKGLLLAAGISGLAVLIKFVVLFPLAGAFLLSALATSGLKKAVFDRRTFLFFLIIFLLGFPHYIFILFTSTALKGTAKTLLLYLPHLLLRSFFWHGWLTQIGRVIGFIPLVFGLVSLALIRDKIHRWFLAGGFLGYFGYGLIFSYYTATHDYYHIALFTLILTSSGYLAQKTGDRFFSVGNGKKGPFPIAILASVAAMILFLSYITADLDILNREAKVRLGIASTILCGNQLYYSYGEKRVFWDSQENNKRITTAKEIGRLLDYNTKSFFLARDYGFPLMYYSRIAGVFWPNTVDLGVYRLRGTPDLSIEERLARYADLNAEFFIVEDMQEWIKQPDLQRFLRKNYRLAWEKENYLIFRMR